MKKQTSWQIVYNSYDGIMKKAVNFINKEASKYLIREEGVYTLYVLPCVKEGQTINKNAFVAGVYGKSKLIQTFVTPDEVKDRYIIKVVENPDSPEGRLVILTANTDIGVYYACVDFFDIFIPEYAPFRGEAMKIPENFFDDILPLSSLYRKLPCGNRSVFTWGHVINDYREYIDDLARMKYNRLIIWNDYMPINSEDIVAYAHSYGMELIWGFAWGWSTEIGNMTTLDDGFLEKLKTQIINEYETVYASSGSDGIYFQSFTEIDREYIGNRLIAEAVTKLVNDVTHVLLKTHPGLRIIFGLHARSVKYRLDCISKVDERVEILWEDGGDFPFAYRAHIKSREDFKSTLGFLEKILALRPSCSVGVVLKGMTVLDWTRFVHQSGPFILGCNDKKTVEHDKALRYGTRRIFASEWAVNGGYALEFVRFAESNKTGELDFCVAASIDGGIHLPEALCAEMFCDADRSFEEILRVTSSKPCITFE